jgi:hypothetical protein
VAGRSDLLARVRASAFCAATDADALPAGGPREQLLFQGAPRMIAQC